MRNYFLDHCKSQVYRSLALLFALTFASMVFAVPARQSEKLIKQSDGTMLTVRTFGDEHFHFFVTSDGLPVLRGANNSYYYAQLVDGHLSITSQLAHDAALRSSEELAFVAHTAATAEDLQIVASAVSAKRNAVEATKRQLRQQAQHLGAPKKVNSGQRRGLVILVNYKDKSMDSTHTREVFEDMFNKEGYTGNGNAMSVHDYFKEQSYGQFDLTFDVMGPVTVSHNMSYYGANDMSGNDKRPGEMVAEACRLVNDSVNFADYDWDGDGEAELVFVVYAGYGEASDPYSGRLDNTIWPHQWYLSSQGIYLELDNVWIDNYACSSELDGSSGTRMDGIGTACHEFSHCFGLPDLYDTYGSNFGMSYWSILDYGCYAGNGYGPVGYTAYERWASGWLEPVELVNDTTITGMKAIAESPEAYVIYNEADKDECYILENRQAVNSDANVPGHGMLVIHLDYDENVWWNNSVNASASRQRCTIIAADNAYSYYSLQGDPFPGTRGKTELTDSTSPSAKLYTANIDGVKLMHKPITEIAESEDGLISFSFKNNLLPNTDGIKAVRLSDMDAETQVEVYNAAGQKVCTTTYADFMAMPLDAGVYIVRSQSQTFKVAK